MGFITSLSLHIILCIGICVNEIQRHGNKGSGTFIVFFICLGSGSIVEINVI